MVAWQDGWLRGLDIPPEAFTGDPDTLRAGEANTVLGPVVGPSSVLLLDGAAHMRQRRLMLPPFHGERMSAYTAILVERQTVREIQPYPVASNAGCEDYYRAEF